MNPVTPQTPPDYEQSRIIERPDGFYWQDKLTDRLYGPFPTLFAAVQDLQERGDTGYGEGESLEEAEAEIGIASWMDSETGAPSEGLQRHLSDE